MKLAPKNGRETGSTCYRCRHTASTSTSQNSVTNHVHAHHCPRGGYNDIRHNEIRYTFAKLLDNVCFVVGIQPTLQPLQGESFDNKTTTTESQVRLDEKTNG